jgi:acyl-CoA-binding protein
MSDLKQQFEDTLNYVKTAEGDFQPSNELKLRMYALFKQASDGDVSGKKPGMMDFVGRAKYQAWEELKGMSADEAMQEYITTIENLKA